MTGMEDGGGCRVGGEEKRQLFGKWDGEFWEEGGGNNLGG